MNYEFLNNIVVIIGIIVFFMFLGLNLVNVIIHTLTQLEKFKKLKNDKVKKKNINIM